MFLAEAGTNREGGRSCCASCTSAPPGRRWVTRRSWREVRSCPPHPAGDEQVSVAASDVSLDESLGAILWPVRPEGVASSFSGRVTRFVESAISSLFASAERGDRAATDALFATLYLELHRLAERQLARSGAGVTLGTTTLLHEAYLDISKRDSAAFPDRARFMGYAARVMRGLIIDYARSRKAQKRGGRFEITSLGSHDVDPVADAKELARISDALDELARADPSLAQVVDLKFFCGFSFAEIAAMRDVSERTVQRHWDKARIYLHRMLRGVRLT